MWEPQTNLHLLPLTQISPKLTKRETMFPCVWVDWPFKCMCGLGRPRGKRFTTMTLKGTSFCRDSSRYFDGGGRFWRASFTFSSPSPSRLFLAAESGCFQNKFLTVYQKIPVPQWWARSVRLAFISLCVCVQCYVREPVATTGHEDGGQMDSMFAGKHAAGTGKLCCLWRTRETNQIWIIFLLFQLLSFAVFSSLASSVTTQWAGLCLCMEGREGLLLAHTHAVNSHAPGDARSLAHMHLAFSTTFSKSDSTGLSRSD